MNFLRDIITYVRRIVKTPSDAVITDNLIIDYINRFCTQDMDARVQLFDLKTKYQFQTQPGYDQYNIPMYEIQVEPGTQFISYYPVYQGFSGPAYINGIQVPLQTLKEAFFNAFPNVTQVMNIVVQGNGTAGPYNFQFPISPNNTMPNPLNTPFNYILRGHVDLTGIVTLATTPGFGIYSDPPRVTNAQALITIPAAPVANVFPAVYITSNGADGRSIVVSDSGQFLDSNQNLGLLMQGGRNPDGNLTLQNGYQNSFNITNITQAPNAVVTAANNFVVGQVIQINNVGGMVELNGKSFTVTVAGAGAFSINVDSTGFTPYTAGGTASSFTNVINYFTGEVTNLIFPSAIPQGVNINAQCYLFATGLPRAILYNNNTLTFRAPPSQQWLVEIDAYLTPAAFISSNQAIQFAYMSEYIARGAARKILSDIGDVEQFQFYEPLFKEQEQLVWKRSQRQFTATRTPTIYSQGYSGQQSYNGYGGQQY